MEEEEEGVFLSGTEDYCTVEVIELLCRSCMLPALASYLLNDSCSPLASVNGVRGEC